ncbi:MAG: hypothetical protein WDO15_11645 [Bacteroidota bacterium]
MELLESSDPEKKRLVEASDRHKRALEKDFMGLSSDTQTLVKNALIIGGVLAVSYFVVRQFSSSPKPKKRKKARKVTLVQPSVSNAQDDDDVDDQPASPSLLADIGTRMANQATVILIDIARQKLMEYLDSRKKEE